MATSGVSSYNPDFDEIIMEAYERCGLQVRDGYDATDGTPVAQRHVCRVGQPRLEPVDN
jgi:hypothetical protein